MRTVCDGDGLMIPPAHAVGAPRRARRDDGMGDPEVQHVIDADWALPMNLYAVELAELLPAVVHDTNPCRQAGQCRFPPHPATEVSPRLEQCDAVVSMPQRPGN